MTSTGASNKGTVSRMICGKRGISLNPTNSPRSAPGLIPCRTPVIDDEEGVPCSSKEAQQLRWKRHFLKVLNLRIQFEEEVLVSVRQR